MEIARVHDVYRAHFDPAAGSAVKKPDPAILARMACAEFVATQSPLANLLTSVSAIGLIAAEYARAQV